jgi:hypothetical protein
MRTYEWSMEHYERANSGARVGFLEVARTHTAMRRGWFTRTLLALALALTSIVVALVTDSEGSRSSPRRPSPGCGPRLEASRATRWCSHAPRRCTAT